MAAYYTPAEIGAITHDVLHALPAALIRTQHAAFTWKNVILPQAWNARVALQTQIVQAVRARSRTALLAAANAVHDWGFGSDVPASLANDPSFLDALMNTLVAFDGATPPYCAARESALTGLLGFNGVGVATVSKWICFVDQSRFGIFDSRVSIALRNICVANDRAFPIVGRQAVHGLVSFTPDTQIHSKPRRVARAYLDYLAVLSGVGRIVHMDAAQVEMALFMIGDVWANGLLPPPRLRRGMWN